MSEENVKAIRGVYERWAKGDFKAGVAIFDPLILFVMGSRFPESGTYLGPDEVTEFTRGFLEPWERISIDAEEIVSAGDSVFAAVRQHGVGIASGAGTEFRYFQVWSFRGDRVIRFENFREREEALEAAGLSE